MEQRPEQKEGAKNFVSPGQEHSKKSNKSKCKDPGAATFGIFEEEQEDQCRGSTVPRY